MHGGGTERQLIIDQTWDGETARSEETARVTLRRRGGGLEVLVDAQWHGDPPPPAAPGPTDRLWEFEVVEVFVAGADPGVPRYTEIELSPFGHHLVLRFVGVRNAVDRGLQLAYSAERSDGRWTGRAVVPARYLPAQPWTANAFAIHGPRDGRRYLAAHPLAGAAPDFHHPERFPALPI
jgi:hypothetical protein